ncbi:MAG: 5-oxoprolinase subunit PxpB [Sphingobacteriales bacterium]|nr:5-oxoprolinase subunit PxpB [Sphingobacteriales bacterium]
MVPDLKKYILHPISEKAISIVFGNQISEAIRQQISRLNRLILANPFLGLLNAIPAYTTLTLFFEPSILLKDTSLKGSTCSEKITFYLAQLENLNQNEAENKSRIIKIPICYEEVFGLDLAELSSIHQLSKEEIIQLHTEAAYPVYMIGFVPGFPYLGGLNPVLNSPRKASPRKVIPAGSVGIAGMQTGIYPLATPGGWQIIGRTPLKLFDAYRQQPSLLKAGDVVKFEPISFTDFQKIYQKEWA